MSAHLGIIKEKSLAEAIKDYSSPLASTIYGVTAMGACAATALAEILGAAIGLQVLFGIPVHIGTLISAGLIGVALWIQKLRSMEKIIVSLVAAIGFCYLVELYIVHPDWRATAHSIVVPTLNSLNLLVAVGLVGAVVMPHNIYLHSKVIQSRITKEISEAGTRRLLRYEFLDTIVSMLVGMAINMAMIVVAAAVFFRHGIVVDDLAQASATLRPIAGRLSSLIFGVALLFAGISSSMTAAITGGTIMSGFLGGSRSEEAVLHRKGIIFTLAAGTLLIFLIHDTFKALIISQVCLSIQLPFTMLPLYLLVGDPNVMGDYATGWFEKLGMIVTGIIIVTMNCLLVYQLLGGKF
jgi:manganese transport protein